MNRRHHTRRFLPTLLALSAVVSACGNGGAERPADSPRQPGQLTGTLRLGYLPNLTHAPAIIGVDRGLFQASLGQGVELELHTFSSGIEVIEALFSGAIDASFVGPNPTINGYAQSEGQALRIVAGSTSGGAALVVRDSIDRVEDLAGTTLATPALGNTQDVALRAWLAGQGFVTTTTGGGDVSVRPQENADTLTTFIDGSIDGAWAPEPWASRLILEGQGHPLLDEREIWADGQFITTNLIVGTDYLERQPAIVRALLSGLLDSLQFIQSQPAEAQAVTNSGLEARTGKRLGDKIMTRAWGNLSFTYDPLASSLAGSTANAIAVGLLKPVDLSGIYDLGILNELLAQRGLKEVTAS